MVKKPFFSRFLESEKVAELPVATPDTTAGAQTNKWPSDKDEYPPTMKYPSDTDEVYDY